MNTPPFPPLKSADSAGGSNPESDYAINPHSIHHKASKYAIIAILGSFGVNFLANLPEQRGTQTAHIVSLIAGVVFISAFPAGIIALCGIKKYGPRKLLWRGLVGVLLPVIGISIGVAAFQGARSAAARLKTKTVAAQAAAAEANSKSAIAPAHAPAANTPATTLAPVAAKTSPSEPAPDPVALDFATKIYIKSVTNEINEGGPRMIADGIRLDKATPGPGRLLTIDLTFVALTAADMDRKRWNIETKPALKEAVLASKLANVLRNDTKLTYRYFDSAGTEIDEMTLSEKDLPNKSAP